MSQRAFTVPEGFCFAEDVRSRLGITSKQWMQLLRAAGVQTYIHASDRRRKLLLLEDAKRLNQPMPAAQRKRRRDAVAA